MNHNGNVSSLSLVSVGGSARVLAAQADLYPSVGIRLRNGFDSPSLRYLAFLSGLYQYLACPAGPLVSSRSCFSSSVSLTENT